MAQQDSRKPDREFELAVMKAVGDTGEVRGDAHRK